MGTRYVNGVDTMMYSEEEIRQIEEEKRKDEASGIKQPKTWVDLHEGEKFGDGGLAEQCKQCRDCMFRDKSTVKGEECGWNKSVCRIFEPPEYKPNYVHDNAEECEFYEKG